MAFKRWLNYPGKVLFFPPHQFSSHKHRRENSRDQTELWHSSWEHPTVVQDLCSVLCSKDTSNTPVVPVVYLLYLLSVACRGVSSISSLCASSWMISDDWILQRILRFTLSFSLSSLQPDEHQTNKDTNEVRLKFTCREKTSKLQTSRLNFILYWMSAHLREWINNSMQ